MTESTTTMQAPPRNGLGTAGMVLGIIAIVLAFIPILGMVSFVLGPLAVIFGGIGFARTRGHQPKANNPVASLFGVGLGAVALVIAIVWTAAIGSAVEQIDQDLQQLEQGAPAAPADPQPVDLQPGQIPEGVHVVGTDIEPGTYRTGGPTNDMGLPCYWARLADTSGSFESIITNGSPSGPATVTIDASDGAFETNGCATWELVN